MKITVRPAEERDATQAVEVVRRSILQLCTADHHNDQKTIDIWLANKTPDNFPVWLADRDNFCVVAESSDALLGVGLLHRSGAVRLLYLVPGVQGRGIGRMIYAELEDVARHWGLNSLHLDSTSEARPFYESLDYCATGAAVRRFGMLQSFPYAKRLRPNNSCERTSLRGSA